MRIWRRIIGWIDRKINGASLVEINENRTVMKKTAKRKAVHRILSSAKAVNVIFTS